MPAVSYTTPAPVLVLIGDRYHNVDYQRLNFARLFKGIGVRFDYTTNYEWFESGEDVRALLAGRKLFVCGRDGLIFPDGYVGPEAYGHYITNLMHNPPGGPPASWVTEEFAVAVTDFVERGGSLYSWHNNLSVASSSPAYRELTRGVYDGHPPERPWRVEVVNRDHPVTRDVGDFMVTDEQHFPVYDGAEGDVLLRGVNIDGLPFDSDSGTWRGSTVSTTAWAFERGGGRVVVSCIGHNLDALWKPDHWKFQTNAVRWLLRDLD